MANAAFISFRGVDKAFGDNKIYEGLDLEVARGETLTILGGSGSGKSVLLKSLIGLERVDAGTIVFDGVDVTRLAEEELSPVRRRISMLFQAGALFDSLTVADNIAYPLRLVPDVDEAQIAARVAETLRLVGLPDIGAQRPVELSGGMKKRVALARAIAPRPDVILYDEPTTGLDPINTRRIVDLIRKIQQELGVTSLVVTHDLVSAFTVSDRIAMLSDRRIVTVLPNEQFRRASLAAVQEFVGAMPVADVHKGAP